MIIGITGTDGAGKGSVVEYLVAQHNFVHYSARALLEAELAGRGIAPDRAQLRLIANELRATYGHSFIVDKALERKQADGAKQCVVESIRALAEVDTLKAAGGWLLAIDAPIEVRYERIRGRGSASDHLSFETFRAQEEIEMNDPDPSGMQKAAVMQAADHTIENATSITELHTLVESWLNSVLEK
jgi:dephospho-CoA kinase